MRNYETISVDPHSFIWDQFVYDDADYDVEYHIPPQQPTHIEIVTVYDQFGVHSLPRQERRFTNRPYNQDDES